MQYVVLRFTRPLIAPYLLACMLLVATNVMADANALHEKYKELELSLVDNGYGIPIHLETNGGKRTMQGDVYGIIHHPFHISARRSAHLPIGVILCANISTLKPAPIARIREVAGSAFMPAANTMKIRMMSTGWIIATSCQHHKQITSPPY